MNGNINIFNNDCLEEMKNIKDKSIDLIFTDLPYGETNSKWDSCIDLELMWKQFKRIRKTIYNTACVLTNCKNGIVTIAYTYLPSVASVVTNTGYA